MELGSSEAIKQAVVAGLGISIISRYFSQNQSLGIRVHAENIIRTMASLRHL